MDSTHCITPSPLFGSDTWTVTAWITLQQQTDQVWCPVVVTCRPDPGSLWGPEVLSDCFPCPSVHMKIVSNSVYQTNQVNRLGPLGHQDDRSQWTGHCFLSLCHFFFFFPNIVCLVLMKIQTLNLQHKKVLSVNLARQTQCFSNFIHYYSLKYLLDFFLICHPLYINTITMTRC